MTEEKCDSMKVIVSACLLGEKCKYNGGDNYNQAVVDFCKDKDVIPLCPETEAGMGVPRIPVEIREGRVIDRDGKDADARYRSGVAKVLEKIGSEKIDLAILKSRSPTCGVHEIYDGTFSGKLVRGRGILAEALARRGISLVDEEDDLFHDLQGKK